MEAEEEDEEEEAEDSDDPWRLLVEEAFERCQSKFGERVTKYMARKGGEEEVAKMRLYMLPTYRKALVNVFVKVILWFHAMRNDRIYLSVKNAACNLKLLDDNDNEEAWESAASKRKF